MGWEDFRYKQVGLLGAGLENLSLVPHLVKVKATVFLCEQNPDALPKDFSYHFPDVKIVTGDKHLEDLGRYDYVFRSPGLPIERVEASLRKVKDRPVITSATDLFLAMTKSVVVGVTGTKGKGTTSTMIGEILQAAGKSVVVAGNIGKPIFSVFDELTQSSIVVLELSSFQLEDLKNSPHVAVVLPITEDHLKPLSVASPNYHQTMNDYVAAKAHITLHQSQDDWLVFAADNAESTAIASVSKAKKIAVSQAAYQTHWNVDPQGVVYRNGEKFTALAKLNLRGQHVFLNATMAIAVCETFGVKISAIEKGLRHFKPLPHRLEDVGVAQGRRYVDDSYATAPEATIAALTAFTEPVVLIAGGSTKGASFDEFAKAVASSAVKGVVLIGQEAPKIAAALKIHAAQTKILDGGKSLDEAVEKARQLSSEGDVILLSPGCASKDMFKNAAERGDIFKSLVRS
ncbi:MAG: UDP-N-acetylmuramoyl-L-alanine--D-glutamate ligase [Candidatus Berkelbacteria bacterium]|nr:MAG: UDP-N-acetylmuramoyl-L-alanine--D-glutamate ligase [Candidatus Berkelbacteria bacterium]QQG51490.1 MAG: UDP-N-acetylmuramoyl-L-alanine--D-glutamate ligase [Candidatus Berkelbacteria bacterium]